MDGVLNGTLNGLRQGAELLHRAQSPVNDAGAPPSFGVLANSIDDLEQVLRNGPAVRLSDLPTYIDAVKNLHGVGVNDRLFLLEKLVTLMSRLPEGTQLAVKIERQLIDTLYKDLPHPPASYLALPDAAPLPDLKSFTNGKRVKYAFRPYDGSYYTTLFPNMGRAGMPYARSVPSLTHTPTHSLPDPGLVFDTLLKRDSYERHPSGVSSLFFAFANLVIHSIFDTSHADETLNGASSYLDLSPLYGGGTGVQARSPDSIRRLDGTGRLWDDTFADGRLLYMPPSSAALLVLLNRNHNYIATKIFDINEKGNYQDPPPKDPSARRDQDDEIYHRARMVNCGFFMQIILRDYVGAILGLARDGHSWRLDPLETMRDASHAFAPQGEGNVCSIEFNMLYRWHSTTSEPDAKWTEEAFRRYFRNKPFDQITADDFRVAAHSFLIPPEDPKTWTFGEMQRGDDMRFPDAALAKIIQNATESPAAAFRARGTPAFMRVIEILGIEQSRNQGICSLNEFRTFMGLKPYGSFKEWNPREEIWKAAEALYGEIDKLELHVGMQAEEAKPPMPGAGLCPGYTISRAILADAVALVRGDRFLTTEFTPYNLTSWGYQDCLADTKDGAYGGILTKLLFRTLPEFYPARSAYAHFPFITPSAMEEAMHARADPNVDKYLWSRPPVPAPLAVCRSYDGVRDCLEAKAKFSSGADMRLAAVTGGTPVDRALVDGVLFSEDSLSSWDEKLGDVAAILIKEKSIDHIGLKGRKYVDIVKHVLNLVPVHLIANNIVGLPLKTNANAHGVYREEELYNMFAAMGNYVMLNLQREEDWHLRESSAACADVVMHYLKGHMARLSRGLLSVAGVRDQFNQIVYARNDESDAFLRQLLAASGNDHEPDEVAASVLSEVVATAALYSSALTHVVEFYLDDARAKERNDIAALAPVQTAVTEERLVRYIREALRLNPPVSAVFRTAKIDCAVDGKSIKAGQRVVASVESANLDRKAVGSEPQEASYAREPKTLGLYCLGGNGLLNPVFFEKTAPRVLRAVFGLKNIARAPGASGRLNGFSQDLHGVRQRQYIDGRGKVTPFPASLVVQYDA